MSELSADSTDLVEDNESALKAFLESPPAGTPEKVLRFVRENLYATINPLPINLFLETVEQAPIAISITDTKGMILYANHAFTKVTGYKREEIIGESESVLSNKTTASTVYRKLWQKLLQQESWHGKLLNRRKSGELYLAEVTIAPVVDENGKTSHYLGMHRDVTDMHKLEQRVHNQKELIESVVDLAPVAKILLSKHRRVILRNRAFAELADSIRDDSPLGFLIEQLCKILGMTFEEICLTGREFHNLEFSAPMEDDESLKWLSCSGRWVQEQVLDFDNFYQPNVHSHLLLVVEDITQQKQRQEVERLAALRALIAEQETVDSLRETLSAAVHQFQAPLNMVGAAFGILQRKKQTNAEYLPLIDVLKQALSSGRGVLTKLRTSIPAQNQIQQIPVNINQLLKDVLSVKTNQLLEGGIVVDWRPEPELPVVIAPAVRLRGMFKQLVDNAIEAIKARSFSDDGKRVLTVKTQQEESDVRIDITDTGDGIPQELRLKIFEPFFSTKENGGLGGVGLAMVQEVVSSLGGTVSVDTSYQGGTRIIVRLPFDIKDCC